MAPSLACLQARIDTFSAPATSKSRRTSSKTKKAPTKSKNAWPLALPSAHDLAFAGFVWKPTTASPDNVQCFACHCQLDGWEENDVPAYEHLTHSPSCGFAVVTCIRLRSGDPGRSEDDPVSDAMMQARRDTFGEEWPLDSNEGYPSIEQLVEAGWYYDPTLDTPDGATCAYCSLSLDAWDIGDDPMEEHRRRAPDCLFFALKEMYHPVPKAAPKKGKRASTRTSNASTTLKTTRGKKRASEQMDDSIASAVEPTRGTKRTSEQIDTTIEDVKPKATRGRKRASTQVDDTISSVTEKPTRVRKRVSTQIDNTIDSVVEKPTRGRKKAAEPLDSTMNDIQVEELPPAPAPKPKAKKAAAKAKRASTASTTTRTRGKKRASDQIEDVEVAESSPKRIRHSSVSSFPDSLLAGTPKRGPPELVGPESTEDAPAELEVEELEADISSLPASLLVGTPKKTPTKIMTPEKAQKARDWNPIDIDAFFGSTEELQALINDVVIDAGLDAIVPAGAAAEDLQAAVLGGLTKSEKEMSVEQWVLYNAKRGEEKLRQACEKQISAFEAEAMRARDTIGSLPTF
ncbi:AT hook domain-containing protein [Stagonosporopsis vannaccii]|nr:AT hook domain-containing protein [Stagonosporopsis vannaccii]